MERNGFTLVELLVCSVILALVVLCLYLYAKSTEEAFFLGRGRAEVHTEVRDALDLMVRDIRHAGYREWHNEIPQIQRLVTADSFIIRYQADLNDDETLNDTNDIDEDITYQFFPGTSQIRRRDRNLGAWEVIANNIDDLTFTYLDANNQSILYENLTDLQERDRVRRIRIDLRGVRRVGNDTVGIDLQTSLRLRNIHFPSKQ